MATLIVKITYGTDIRRFTSNSATLTWSSLSKKVAELFGLPASHGASNTPKTFKLTYVDDEGDRITMSSEDEFTEAVGLALTATPSVLRLTVTDVAGQDKKAGGLGQADVEMSDASTDAPAGAGLPDGVDPRDLTSFLNNLATQLPTLVSQLPEGVRRLIPRAELDVAASLAANAVGNASCAAAAAARNVANAAAAAASSPMGDPSTDANPDGVHPGVTCDRSGMCPIVGNRYNLAGHNYDLCEAEFLKLDEREKALYHKIPPPFVAHIPPSGPPAHTVGVHPGVECDKSGMCPIMGIRYNLRGQNYDLCQAEYDKLAAADKLRYVAIPPPVHPRGNRFGGGFGGGWRCGGWGGAARGDGGKLGARFVRDVSIFDGTQMAPSTSFTKIWRLKNSGEVAWPAGTRFIFVGGDQMTHEVSVPLSRSGPIAPGEEVDIAVEMNAPSEIGRYLGNWRLVGPNGRRKFGQRVWCHIQVVDPSAPEASLAQSEDDLRRTVEEIRQKKSDLEASEADADEPTADDMSAAILGGALGAAAAAASEASEAVAVAVAAPPAAAAAAAGKGQKGQGKRAQQVAPTKPCARAGCAYGVTWHKTHCCNACFNTGKNHGPRCARLAFTVDAPPAAEEVLMGEPIAAAGGEDKETGEEEEEAAAAADRCSDDGSVVLVTEGMLQEPKERNADGLTGAAASDAAGKHLGMDPADGPDTTTPEGVKAALASMGFDDLSLVEVVIAKHGADLDACARDLAAATEWDSLLDDLSEMGFENRDLNRTLMLKHDGNVKRTVKALVEDA